MHFYFKNFVLDWKKLWNLWLGITEYHMGSRRVATLYARIRTPNNCLFRSQEFDLLLISAKIKLKTGTMVLVPLWIWYQIDTPTGNKNDLIGCFVTTFWPWNREHNNKNITVLLEAMFINLINMELLGQITASNKMDKDAINAIKTLFEAEPKTLWQTIDDWMIKQHKGKNILFYKGQHYTVYEKTKNFEGK